MQQSGLLERVAPEEDREEEISGAQFLCETVIRSLTLEEAPDHRPLRRAQSSCHKPQGETSRHLSPSYSPPHCSTAPQSNNYLLKP